MASRPSTADELRRAFVEFFTERGHVSVPSASVIPVDPSLLFTVAGMVPFKGYFTGDEAAPFPRAVSVQKCVRAGGKHNDLDDIGRTNRHFSFFEMLGNFSFGDYFKADAIRFAWDFYTEVLGIDTSRLWVTVHEDDDDAERIWRDDIGFPADRIQRLGDDNFWRMGDTGPCGPSSEIFWDLGPEHGPDGGPRTDSGRYIEIWNLVFMQFDQQADGTRLPLPKPSIDTGAGLERNLMVVQAATSIWDIDVFRPLIATAESVTGVEYGKADASDVSLRILAEHARTMAFMVADGVVPSNEERGYVLRRIIRRAVRHAYLLGSEQLVTPELIDTTVAVMGGAYPELVAKHDHIRSSVTREEQRFRATLARGVEMLDVVLARGDVSGDDAFFLHDTLGFPIDLTREIASERGHAVDLDGFAARMQEQRVRAQTAHKEAGGTAAVPLELYRELLDEVGATEFTGRQEYESRARVGALVLGGARIGHATTGARIQVVLDRTPFYAESGGQVGDTGTIVTDRGARIVVHDTQYGLPGTLVVHDGEVTDGEVFEGDDVTAHIDGARRDAIRRNHTATHVLHWALREVLGTHVQQAGSLVAPDRLRFDFSHFEAVTADQLAQIEALANAEVITDAPVRHYETTIAEAQALGAIAFFGEKYGDVVRVLEAGEHSIELCGGTHVHALGFIGPIKILSEGSIGSNLRRIEAVTGGGALEHIRAEEATLREIGALLKATPAEVPEKVERLVEQVRSLSDELARLRAQAATAAAGDLAAAATAGVLVQRHDGAGPDDLRRLAHETLRRLGTGVVVLAGRGDDGAKAGIAVAVSPDLVDRGASAAAIAAPAARALGGGTAKHAELVAGGGPNVDAIDDALALAAEQAAEWRQ
ncbi:MAG TPA: alanine--tRNA ligase [Acidimicrobiia bacterium]|nr:alanine--tRNA ligase [Acidimicrobiia bacterium]